MEFAVTVLVYVARTDDSWLPRGARSFFVLLRGSNNSRCPSGRFCKRRGGRRIGANLRLILIAVFGAIGTLARYGLQGFVQIRAGGTFPYGTLLINLTGCFFLGLIGQFTLNRMVISPDWRMAIAVGFFGGYTTFSSFGWETAKMLEDGEWLPATTYVAASVVAGLFLSVAGIRLANRF
jgi:CrcB protein